MRSASVFLLELGEVVGGVHPFLDEAARGTEIPRHLDGANDSSSDHNVVSCAITTDVAWDSNDVGGLALWARLGSSHIGPCHRGVRPAVRHWPTFRCLRQ